MIAAYSASGEVIAVDIIPRATDTALQRLARLLVCSLLTDCRAQPGDETPDNDPRGFWGDPSGEYVRSPLWLLVREPITTRTVERVNQAINGALEWWIRDKIATSIECSAYITANGFGASVTIGVNTTQTRINLPNLSDLWR